MMGRNKKRTTFFLTPKKAWFQIPVNCPFNQPIENHQSITTSLVTWSRIDLDAMMAAVHRAKFASEAREISQISKKSKNDRQNW